MTFMVLLQVEYKGGMMKFMHNINTMYHYSKNEKKKKLS